MFGTLVAIGVPFAFALVTIPSTLGAVWIFAHFMDMAVYVTEHRHADRLRDRDRLLDAGRVPLSARSSTRTESATEALVTTMRTAGRATLFSGATVAIGLALLVFMPLPFMRSMGVGGLLVPLFSIAAVGDLPAGAALGARAARSTASG